MLSKQIWWSKSAPDLKGDDMYNLWWLDYWCKPARFREGPLEKGRGSGEFLLCFLVLSGSQSSWSVQSAYFWLSFDGPRTKVFVCIYCCCCFFPWFFPFNSLLWYVIISTAQHVSTSLDNWRYCLKFLYPVTLSKWSSWVPPCCFYNLWKGYFVILLHEKFLKFDWLRAVVFPLNLKYLHVKITNLLW